MPARVVDASALAAVLFGEPEGERVAKALGPGPLLVPTLLRYEIANVAVTKIRRHPEARSALVRALALFPRLDVREVAVPAAETTELAEESGLSAYDAAYLWLARTLGVELVTLDARLGSVAPGRRP